MRRVLDILSGALAGAWLTIMMLGNALDADTHAYARDGILLLLAILTIARFVVERRNPVMANG